MEITTNDPVVARLQIAWEIADWVNLDDKKFPDHSVEAAKEKAKLTFELARIITSGNDEPSTPKTRNY